MRAKPPRGSLILPGHPANKGLVALWPMNEGAGGTVFDASGNGNTGSITATSWTSGHLGRCLAFDGSTSIVSCGSNYPTSLRSAITLLAWVNITDGETWPRIITSEGDWSLLTASTGLSPLRFYGSSIDAAFPDSPNLRGTGWRHVAATYSGNGIKGYVDGVTAGTIAKTGLLDAPAEVTIGDRASGGRALAGLIDNVMIFDRALTASEIASLYMDPWQGFQQDPIELWTAATSGAVSGDITVEPSALALQLSLNAPTVNWDYLLSVAAQSLVVGLPTPDVSGEVNITVAPDALNLALSIQTPTLTYDYVVSPDALALLLSQQSVTTAYDYVISPDALSLLLGLSEPTTSGATNITITPDALGLVLGLQAPTTIYDYQVALGSALALVAALNEPTAGTSLTVSVDAQGLTVSLQTPTTLYDYLVSVDAQGLELSVQEPSTLFDFVYEVAAALGMTATINEPTVSGSTGRTYIVCSSTDPAQLDFYIGGTLVARFT